MNYERLYMVVFFLCIGLAAYGGLTWLLYTVNESTRTLVAETAERRAQLKEELSLKAFADDIRANTDVLERVAIPSKGIVDFIESLEKLGRDQGVELSTASVKEVEKVPFNELVLQVSADGSWTQLTRIVQLLEIMPTQTTITSIDLHVLDASGPVKKGKVAPLPRWRLALELSAIKIK